MSSFSIFQIAGSALTAQSQRLNVSASNLANADSVVGQIEQGPGAPRGAIDEIELEIADYNAMGTFGLALTIGGTGLFVQTPKDELQASLAAVQEALETIYPAPALVKELAGK